MKSTTTPTSTWIGYADTSFTINPKDWMDHPEVSRLGGIPTPFPSSLTSSSSSSSSSSLLSFSSWNDSVPMYTCSHCSQPLFLLTQLPDFDSNPMKRTMFYLFGCNSQACMLKSGSFKAIRKSIWLNHLTKDPSSMKLKQDNPLGLNSKYENPPSCSKVLKGNELTSTTNTQGSTTFTTTPTSSSLFSFSNQTEKPSRSLGSTFQFQGLTLPSSLSSTMTTATTTTTTNTAKNSKSSTMIAPLTPSPSPISSPTPTPNLKPSKVHGCSSSTSSSSLDLKSNWNSSTNANESQPLSSYPCFPCFKVTFQPEHIQSKLEKAKACTNSYSLSLDSLTLLDDETFNPSLRTQAIPPTQKPLASTRSFSSSSSFKHHEKEELQGSLELESYEKPKRRFPKLLHQFLKRYEHHPGHVLRWKGTPLHYSDWCIVHTSRETSEGSTSFENNKRPFTPFSPTSSHSSSLACSTSPSTNQCRCGGQWTFMYQVMPSLLSILPIESMAKNSLNSKTKPPTATSSNTFNHTALLGSTKPIPPNLLHQFPWLLNQGMEFGTILVFTCEHQCIVNENDGYLEEQCIVQLEQ